MSVRSFRMYGKKRRHRRTGSNTMGSLGEAVICALFLAIGSVFLVLLLRMPVLPEWRANHDFAETPCTVLDKRLGQRPGSDGGSYRPEILIRYTVGDRTLETWTYDITFNSTWGYAASRESPQSKIDRFTTVKQYPCWYDPDDPATAVVVRGYSGWLWSLLLLPVSFMIIGGAGLLYIVLHWGKSTEHRAAARQLAARLDMFDETASMAKDFPNVPRDANLTNSPGTRLKYRLPIHMTHGLKLFVAAWICVGWNVLVMIFLVMAFRRGADWRLLLFTLPFLAIGIGMIYFLFRQILIATGVGPTQLEISDHPLLPGRRYDLFLSQAGRLTMNYLDIDLVCDEEATFRQGTDARTEQRRVFCQPLFQRKNFDIPLGMPFEQQCRVEIPAEAMHSFSSDHNEIQWKFVVRGEVKGWPKYERSFPIVVYPKPIAARRA